jgi:Mn-dependent DtxR family transcriptional regulator
MNAKAKPSRSRSAATGPKGTRERVFAKILSIIKSHPGIRPSELNRRLKVEQSDALRDALIRRGLVHKVKDGRATHLYAK